MLPTLASLAEVQGRCLAMLTLERDRRLQVTLQATPEMYPAPQLPAPPGTVPSLCNPHPQCGGSRKGRECPPISPAGQPGEHRRPMWGPAHRKDVFMVAAPSWAPSSRSCEPRRRRAEGFPLCSSAMPSVQLLHEKPARLTAWPGETGPRPQTLSLRDFTARTFV